MNPAAALNNPFVTTALPIMVTILLAVWMNSKAFDGVHKRLDDIIARLARVETKLDNHESRLATLEERTSPLTRTGR